MKMLRPFGLVVFLICMVVMCCACGGSKFNSIKDVDCFVEKERLKPKKYNDAQITIRHHGIPQDVKTNNKIVAGVDLALSSPVGVAAKVFGYKPWVNGKKLFLRGSVFFRRYYTIYRKEDGKILKDIPSVAIKMMEGTPESPCCDNVKVAAYPTALFKQEYMDEKSHIIASNDVEVVVVFQVKDSVKNGLSEEDWKPFLDYLNKVCSNIKDMVEEDFKNPSPYCPEGGV